MSFTETARPMRPSVTARRAVSPNLRRWRRCGPIREVRHDCRADRVEPAVAPVGHGEGPDGSLRAAAGGTSTTGRLGGGYPLGRHVAPERCTPRPAVAWRTRRRGPAWRACPTPWSADPARPARPAAAPPTTHRDCRTKWLNGPPAKAMPPVSVGVAAGSSPRHALLHPHRGRESRSTPRPGGVRAAAGRGARVAARPSASMAGHCWRCRRAVRATACRGMQRHMGEGQRSDGRRPPRPFGRADQEEPTA